MLKKISPYDLLSSIFDNINTQICSDCPEAKAGGTFWEWRTKECGCCAFCAQKKGHLEHFAYNPDFEDIKEYFNDEYGFFDNEQKTCRLPRSLRSICCMKYTCDSMKKVLKEKHGEGIIAFIENTINEIQDLREAEAIAKINSSYGRIKARRMIKRLRRK